MITATAQFSYDYPASSPWLRWFWFVSCAAAISSLSIIVQKLASAPTSAKERLLRPSAWARRILHFVTGEALVGIFVAGVWRRRVRRFVGVVVLLPFISITRFPARKLRAFAPIFVTGFRSVLSVTQDGTQDAQYAEKSSHRRSGNA